MKGRVINMSLVTTKEMFEKAMKEQYGNCTRNSRCCS